jgi:hypothetical protein
VPEGSKRNPPKAISPKLELNSCAFTDSERLKKARHTISLLKKFIISTL